MSHNLADAFLALAARWPDRPAVQSQDTNLTFSQLVDRARRIAAVLQKGGVSVGDRVGIARRAPRMRFC
jgi:acyl-CoA synthetase (AMP-forming)/AMP-acid ligase II